MLISQCQVFIFSKFDGAGAVPSLIEQARTTIKVCPKLLNPVDFNLLHYHHLQSGKIIIAVEKYYWPKYLSFEVNRSFPMTYSK